MSERWWIEETTMLIHDAAGRLFADHDQGRKEGFRGIRSNELEDCKGWGYKPCQCVVYEGLRVPQ